MKKIQMNHGWQFWLTVMLVVTMRTALTAANYDFFSVGAASNQTTLMTSPNGRGTIKVTTVHSANGAGLDDQKHALINNSKFPVLFPGTPPIQGHLIQSLYNSTVTVTYDLSAYSLGNDTVFGLWNMTDDIPTNPPPYRLELRDAGGALIAPGFSWSTLGNDDNTLGNPGTSKMQLDFASGKFVNPSKNGSHGSHSDAQFWNKIPGNAKRIILYGNLSPISNNTNGDGVGSYFAEEHSETNKFLFKCGMSVVTCFSDSKATNATAYCQNGGISDPKGYVVALFDTTLPVPSSTGVEWTAVQSTGYHNEFGLPANRFTQANLGEVFGLALDDSTPANIYVAATTLYPGDTMGPAGPGGIYKIDGGTLAISTLISLKNVGAVALGNICYDPINKQIIAADLDNGLLRRVSTASSTELLPAFDHGANLSPPVFDPASSTIPGDVTSPGRRMFAVQYRGSRIFYSLYTTNIAACGQMSEIWSIGLDASSSPPGAFILSGPNGPKLEFKVPPPICNTTYPSDVWVTDIAFSKGGKMLIAERGVCSDERTNLKTGAHHSRGMELVQTAGTWGLSGLNPLSFGSPSLPATVGNNSAGGVDYFCDDTMALMSDGVAVPGNPVGFTKFYYGLQINPPGTVGRDNAYWIDLNNNTTGYDKNFLGDVEVYRCCDCVTFNNERIECTATNQFTWTFCATNTGTLTVGHFVFVPPLPPGVTVNTPIIDLPTPLAPGQGICTNVVFTLDPKFKTNQLCFRLAAHTPDYANCCVVTKCLTLPDCCGIVRNDRIVCNPATGNLTWTFQIQNANTVPAQYLFVVPEQPSCVSVANPLIVLPSLLLPGQSTTVTVPLSVIGSPCTNACFRLSFHDTNFVNCCSFTHCVPIICKQDGHPPTVKCPPFTLLCDTNKAVTYVTQVLVQDADGDPLTVVWKVNSVPVKTNSVPGGLTVNPTPVSFTNTYPSGVYIITVCVVDQSGATAICDFDLEIGDHTPPQIKCPPDRIVTKWDYVLPNLLQEVTASDNCTPKNLIKFTQQPPAGTVLPPGVTCVKITATDSAGNTASCVTCITVRPVIVSVPDATNVFFGTIIKAAPADIVLIAIGDLANTASVEYLADGKSIGMGTGADFRFVWSKVPAGTYSLSVRARSSRVGFAVWVEDAALLQIYVAPAPGSGSARPVRTMDARKLYEGVGAHVEDGNCYCSLEGKALTDLGA